MAVETAQELAERISSISVSSTMKVSSEADRLRRQGVDVVDFGAGEPDFPTPDNIKRAAVKAIEENFTKYTAAGGTTIRDFQNADAAPGYFARELRVYGRDGEPCTVCGTPIRRRVLGQRSTYWCPECQR